VASLALLGRRILRSFGKGLKKPLDSLDNLGGQLSFYARALGYAPKTLVNYKKEVTRLLAEVSLGSGALTVIGGTVGVIAFICFFTGTEVGLEGYQALNQLGSASLTGFISAYFNTREIAPLVAGLALAATVGCGFTATLGAMRVSEEIDALEVMAVPSVRYLATRVIVGFQFKQSTGTYDHYFHEFLPPIDVFYSLIKVIIFAVVIVLIHCYNGYNASGGPAGVGVAVGRAIRTSLVAINVVDFFLSLALWGATATVRLAG